MADRYLEYDPVTNIWTQLTFQLLGRYNSRFFVVNNKVQVQVERTGL
jgi:hypothetical protein